MLFININSYRIIIDILILGLIQDILIFFYLLDFRFLMLISLIIENDMIFIIKKIE